LILSQKQSFLALTSFLVQPGLPDRNTIQKPGFSASNKPCQANIRSNFGKFNSSDTKNLVSWLRFDRVYGVTPDLIPLTVIDNRSSGQ
jgi:hypothetical protein